MTMMMSTSTSFKKRELYGGAMAVELPEEYIDASNLRQVPSHQELYLSPTTLTSVLIEINSYLESDPSLTTSSSPSHSTSNTLSTSLAEADSDSTAVAIHFHDPVQPPDTSSLQSLTPVHLTSPSLRPIPAYLAQGSIISHDRGADRATTTTTTNEIRSWVLVVRLQQHDTDVCVRVDVPLKEFGTNPLPHLQLQPQQQQQQQHSEDSTGKRENGSQVNGNSMTTATTRDEQEERRRQEEVEFAIRIVEKVSQTLQVKDWGLFDG